VPRLASLTKKGRLVVLAVVGVALVGSVALLRISGDDELDRQEIVAERGREVMPFDLDATMHRFRPTEDGGVQEVVAKDPSDRDQVRLVRDHLREEAERFAVGDFDDPAAIHGHDMPGLRELRAAAGRISIEYSDLPDGARIAYVTDDPSLIEALHRWFRAQVHDHGDHAEHVGHG
jgi:hypothetical protein